MKTKKIISVCIILLFGSISFPGCDSESVWESYDNPQFLTWMYFSFFNNRNRLSTDSYTYEDLADGTVKQTTYSTYNSVITASEVLYLKKCLQGQTYRLAQNDCQGTGNAGNNYGATTLQYCNANNNSCNSTNFILNNLGSSAAYNSCAADTTAGKTWRVASSGELYTLLVSDSLTVYFPQIGTDYIWANDAYQATQARVFAFGGSSIYVNKTDSYYVLCASN